MRRLGEPTDPVMVGRFELVREIGYGTYGRVYEAIDHDFGRHVAVKVLDIGDPDVAMREGKVLAAIKHPNVVSIFDHGIGPDYRYFVMELLEGPTLRTWWRDKTVAEIVLEFLGLMSGLASVHAMGLVHRDLKPSNVRIGSDGRAVVVDFGLARHLATLADDPEEFGVFAGTTDYAPPERLLGLPGDERADQFSLCVAMWEALSGTNPFGPCSQSTTPEERFRSIRGQAEFLGTPRASRRVVRALRRGLSFAASDRFPNMQALAAALAPKPRRWGSRHLLGAALCGVMVAGVVTQLMPARTTPGVLRGSIEFVATARVSRLGQAAIAVGAIAATREGHVDVALGWLEEAKRAELSEEASRELAMASGVVAAEFERRAMYDAAADACYLAILFARDAGDLHLERRSRRRLAVIQRAAWAVPH